MAERLSSDVLHRSDDELFVRQLYMELAGARAARLEQVLWQAAEMPEPIAETLTLAAAGLVHVADATCPGLGELARAADVSRRLIAEAGRHDPRAAALAEQALLELEHVTDMDCIELAHEAAESLAWACAMLRRDGCRLEDSEDGNADQLELAWMCLIEAAELLMAADRAEIEVREAAG